MNKQRTPLWAWLAGLVVIAVLIAVPMQLNRYGVYILSMWAVMSIAAIVGGFNQIRGAIAGGLLLGVIDNLMAAYVSAQYRAAVPLLLLIAVILFRPQGLLGRAEERTV